MGYSRKMFIILCLLVVSLGFLLLKVPLQDTSSLKDLLISSIAVLSVIFAIFFPLYLDYLSKRETLDFPFGKKYFYFVFLLFSFTIFLFLVLLYFLPALHLLLVQIAFIVFTLTGACLVLVARFITTGITHVFAPKILYRDEIVNMEALLHDIDERKVVMLRRIGLDADWKSTSREYVTRILNKMFRETLFPAFKYIDFFEAFFGSRKRGTFGERNEGIISIYFKKLPFSNLEASDLYPYMERVVGEYVSFACANFSDNSTAFTDTIDEIAEFSTEIYKGETPQYKNEIQWLFVFLCKIYLGIKKRPRDRESIFTLICSLIPERKDLFMKAYESLITRVSFEEQEDLRLLLERIREAQS